MPPRKQQGAVADTDSNAPGGSHQRVITQTEPTRIPGGKQMAEFGSGEDESAPPSLHEIRKSYGKKLVGWKVRPAPKPATRPASTANPMAMGLESKDSRRGVRLFGAHELPQANAKANKARESARGYLIVYLALSTAAMAVLLPSTTALWWYFVSSTAAFGLYALYVAVIRLPTSFSSLLGTWLSVAALGIVATFVAVACDFGVNTQTYAGKKACSLYRSVVEDYRNGVMSTVEFHRQLKVVEGYAHRSSDPHIVAAGSSMQLKNACSAAGY